MAIDANACSRPQASFDAEGHVAPYFGRQALMTYDSSHDTFVFENHKHFLEPNAGIGIYAHGRVHQQVGYTIYVGDLIHKRGSLVSDDILLMTEQNLQSMGESLSVNSKLGGLLALAVLPTSNSANGEGELIAYYENGVVSFDTAKAPRETRHDGQGVVIQKGWDSMRLVSHLLNTVSAVGRYAVAVLTRDHFFRSRFGLHFLKTVLGEGTFNSENVNRISMDVDPILEADKSPSLSSCGFWPEGHRMFASVGEGRGMVSWNQAVTYTEDRTPIPAWEGLWTLPVGTTLHKFEDWGGFGFVCSVGEKLHFARISDKDFTGEWSFETARFAPSGLDTRSSINGMFLEGIFTQDVVVLIRTDLQGEWVLWKNVKVAKESLIVEALGEPQQKYRECTWVQVRVEGTGYAEIRDLSLDYSASVVKSGRSQSNKVIYSEKSLWP